MIPVRTERNTAGEAQVSVDAFRLSRLVDDGFGLRDAVAVLSALTPSVPGRLYRNQHDLMLERARLWPEDDARFYEGPEFTRGACYSNAINAAMGSDLLYVEGWASVEMPVTVRGEPSVQPMVYHHAFCFDGEGVVEPSWPVLAKEYFGVVIPTEYVLAAGYSTGWFGVFPNDSVNGNDLLVRGVPGIDWFPKTG